MHYNLLFCTSCKLITIYNVRNIFFCMIYGKSICRISFPNEIPYTNVSRINKKTVHILRHFEMGFDPSTFPLHMLLITIKYTITYNKYDFLCLKTIVGLHFSIHNNKEIFFRLSIITIIQYSFNTYTTYIFSSFNHF